MIGGILLIALAVFGLSWLFGFGKPERLLKFIIWLIAGPLVLGLFYNEWLSLYGDLPLLGRVALIIAIPFIFLFALRVLFPGSKGISTTTTVLWELIIFALTFPFRLAFRSGRQIAARESNKIRLQRHRAVVGGRPPLHKSATRER